MKNYSKAVVRLMVILWFIGAAFGGAVVIAELVMAFVAGSPYTSTVIHIPDLLNYIGIPMSCAIAGYLAKSAFENREKIKNNPGYRENEHEGA